MKYRCQLSFFLSAEDAVTNFTNKLNEDAEVLQKYC